MLALAAGLAFVEGGEDAYGGGEAGENVYPGGADLGGASVRLSGDAHDAGHALEGGVVAGFLGSRAGLSEAGDRGVDDSGVDGGQGFVVEAEALEVADLEVFDDDVGLAGEGLDYVLASGVAQVDYEAFLSAVCGEVVCALRSDEWGAPSARVVAPGRFYLPDRSSEVREYLRPEGACQNPGHIQHRYIAKRSHCVTPA